MTTELGAYDKLLQAFAHSIRDLLVAEGVDCGGEVFRRLRVCIGQESVSFTGFIYKEVRDKVRTAEFGELLQVLRRWFPDTAWPIDFELAFKGQAMEPRLNKLSFAGAAMRDGVLHRGDRLAASGAPFDGYEVRGLGKVCEAAEILCELFPASGTPIMAWSMVDSSLYETKIHKLGIHARSAEEAILKWLFSKHGFDVVAAACRSGKVVHLARLSNINFVAQPVHGLEVSPRGLPLDASHDMAALQQRVSARVATAPVA
jgi:hypothetical protein